MKRFGPAAVILIFGVATAIQAYRLGMGSITQPGPGFFPFWVSAALVVIASFMLVGASSKSLVANSAVEHAPSTAIGAASRVAAAVGAIGFLAIALQYLGFLLTALFFLILCWIVIDRLPALRAILISTVCALIAFALFVKVLNIHFPRGLLEF